ncbi:hypothetical protein B6U74_00600 [Candidatus Bathyarchaeota archaeon ex4484_205]|nr:MAG: hypothetical protein B6U74_00600 [Candidatus Bathyarchaeota archaeon ex4484_205]RLA92924.1 MAG: hypothetical protein DRG83_21740 [Deltaproteobacteria bacterium]RLG69402.1 MAG: hypothetical protein DRN93_00130 [archaeon]
MTDDESRELEEIKKKKMKQLLRRLQAKQKISEQQRQSLSPRDVVISRLVGRGSEVLNAAESQYPEATQLALSLLAKLILSGRIRGKISGEELYGFFRGLGIPVKLRTRIMYYEKGELKTLGEKLRESHD